MRRPKTVVLLFALLVAAAAAGAVRLKEEEDLLVFLPTHDRDVRLFEEVSHTFGSLRVALIGVETPTGRDVFAADTVNRLRHATDAIRNLRGIDRVVSMTSVSDVVPSPDGVEVTLLVPAVPSNAAEERALAAKVLSREHVAGSLVSRDGRAALIMVFLAEGIGDRAVCEAVRQVAERDLRPLTLYYGGAPYAGRAIYQEAQSDVWRLSPVALLMLLMVVVLSFRDAVGVLLTVLSVAISALVVLGGMGWWGEKFTVASSTLPVILFASGSSYAVHVLGRYYLQRATAPPLEAMRQSIEIVGPPLLVAGATTAVGFFAFVVTDVRPMRAFGIGCGAGVLICWFTSLTLVPAVVALWPRRAAPHRQLGRVGDAMVTLWSWARRHRKTVVVSAVILAAAVVGPMTRVTVRMEPRAFFRVGSEPWLAENFLTERFGGATFVQVALRGDLDDPATLREIARLEDFTRQLANVTQVQAVTQPLRVVNDVMGGGARLPATAAQAANLYFFLEGEPGMRALLGADRRDALVHVRVKGDSKAAVVALEAFVAHELRAQPGWPSRQDVAERLAWIARAAGRQPDQGALERALRVVALPGDADVAWSRRRREVVEAFLRGDEVPPMAEPARARLIELGNTASAALGPELVAAAPSPEEGQLAWRALSSRIDDARRVMGVERAQPLVLLAAHLDQPPPDAAVLARVATTLDDAFAPPPAGAARAPLSGQVAGEPILDRGFSRSVGHNLDRSLIVSIVIVLVILLWLFRSVGQSLLCMAPSLLTMGIVFGAMGALGVHIDLGTSLVAGIATGAGSDFCMHYMWYLRRQPADEVSRTVGPVMVVSIVLVSLGFLVLALGRSPVMKLFGTLAAASMFLSALLTCLLVPPLADRVGLGVDLPAPPSKPQQPTDSMAEPKD